MQSKMMNRRHGKPRPAAGDETRRDDQLPAAFVELAFRPAEAFLRLLALEEAAMNRLAEPAPEEVGEVVAEHRADGADKDHEREADLALGREDAPRDHRGL